MTPITTTISNSVSRNDEAGQICASLMEQGTSLANILCEYGWRFAICKFYRVGQYRQ